ncbi:hypothetical protein CAC42_490 [Sphaceloma murrayae]|uniref:C-factor n=1 Tax=Sphaceloma murrayae TaxID=2082308 RepID=A0A2K1R3M3_9PEZI|nr:hypothetical protein CAC42_490 [Sphaceloma murrayae]
MGRNVVITGAASGLGLEFLRHYSRSDPTNTVYGIDQQPCKDAESMGNVQFHELDVTSESSLAKLQTSLSGIPIDLVVHSAGIRGLVSELEDNHPPDVNACETLDVMTPDTMLRTFNVNAIGTFALLRSLVPNLRKTPGSKVVVMSSRMGSVGRNSSGSAYAYRASKAAQNAIVKSLAIDVPDVFFILCHPGRVETKLVKWKEEGAIPPKESVSGIVALIEEWGKSDSGKFYDRFGEPIEW